MPNYEILKKDFIKLVESGCLSHAYLFFGGNENDRKAKFDFALSLANYLENKNFEIPKHPLSEVLIIEKAEETAIGIDAIRTLKFFLYQTAIISKNRVVIIENSEDMTPEAQNAILKIIEEPPPGSLIIFIARNTESLFGTLVSRLQKIHFPSLNVFESVQKENWKNLSIEDILENNEVDKFFELVLWDLGKDPIRNFRKLKETLKRLTFIKQFNTNKKLQLKVLGQILFD